MSARGASADETSQRLVVADKCILTLTSRISKGKAMAVFLQVQGFVVVSEQDAPARNRSHYAVGI